MTPDYLLSIIGKFRLILKNLVTPRLSPGFFPAGPQLSGDAFLRYINQAWHQKHLRRSGSLRLPKPRELRPQARHLDWTMGRFEKNDLKGLTFFLVLI